MDPAFLVDLTLHDLRRETPRRFFEKGLNPMQVAAESGIFGGVAEMTVLKVQLEKCIL